MPNISGDSPEKHQVVTKILELLHDHSLEQLNTTPTRGSNTLALVLKNVPNKVKICEVLSPAQAELFTDHHVFLFELLLFQLPKIRRTDYDYPKGDFWRLTNFSWMSKSGISDYNLRQYQPRLAKMEEGIPRGSITTHTMNETKGSKLYSLDVFFNSVAELRNPPHQLNILSKSLKSFVVPSSVCYVPVASNISTPFVPVVNLIPKGVVKTRNITDFAEYAGISRNFAEYHGISWFMSNVPLCFVYFSLTGTVSTSPNLARAQRASNDCRATRSL